MKNIIIVVCILFQSSLTAQAFKIDTLQWKGNTTNRINVVIMGDGFQKHELDIFNEKSSDFVDYFFSVAPFNNYINYFNFFSIGVISNESGASHPGTASDVSEPVIPVTTVDNYFGSTFDTGGIHRLLAVTNNSAVADVLAHHIPYYDVVLILVNSTEYGGSGGTWAVSSLNSSAFEIAVHEIGHSFGSLSDEYYAGDQYSKEAPNMTADNNNETVRWKNWMNINDIGIYQHCCTGNSAEWYRPHENCKMRYLNRDFCSVCKQQLLKQIHYYTTPVDSFAPDSVSLNNTSFPIVIKAYGNEPLNNSLSYTWKLNGNMISCSLDSLLINLSDLSAEENTITAEVSDNNPEYLKLDNYVHYASYTWQINTTAMSFEQTIELASGWNLISIGVELDDMSVPNIFPQARVVKNFDAFYDSALPSYFNKLKQIKPGDGYLVYTTEPHIYTLKGKYTFAQ